MQDSDTTTCSCGAFVKVFLAYDVSTLEIYPPPHAQRIEIPLMTLVLSTALGHTHSILLSEPTPSDTPPDQPRSAQTVLHNVEKVGASQVP
ncbi:hypothetical protein HYPSUDRAFT_39047 [Hypholoma sublateritium FD-334 SS-4]|uniref:Uncharacterized protein n=1 Tax=Hypholoma sublateritium (strain FD-334 SS-4) TaxID=945553 RepID=A0A0D2P025_HYPSF|nr:hypothetical protein HYPSUDRAFT_39047 [Hypholoma sublateritium FD-334 SS-4]